MKRKKFLSTAMLLSVIMGSSSALVGCGNDVNSNGIKVFKLEKRELVSSVSATGNIDGVRLNIENSQNTKAVKVNVNEGDFVEKGDVLFEFDNTDLKKKYEQLSSQYEIEDDKIKHEQSVNQDKLDSTKTEKKAMLQQAQRKIDEATKTYNEAYQSLSSLEAKYRDACKYNDEMYQKWYFAASIEETEEYEPKYNQSKAEMQSIGAELDQAKINVAALEAAVKDAKDNYTNLERQYNDMISDAENVIETEKFVTNSVEENELKELKKKIDGCVITAPISGVVVSPHVIEGAIPGTELLATIVDTSDLSVNVTVSEYDIPNVGEDMEVIIRTSATGTDEIKGSVKKISHMNVASDAGILYPVEIDIDEETLSEDLYIGMTARTEIISSKKENVFAVPYDIFITEEDKNFIMAAIPDGDKYVAKKIPVELGEETSYYVEITSDELEEEMLIITDSTGVKEGKKVNVVIE